MRILFEPLPAVLRRATKFRPAAQLVAGSKVASIAQMEAWSDRLAVDLQRVGVRPGDRVAICLSNTAEFVVSCFAIWKVRAMTVSLSRESLVRSGLFQFRDARPACVIVDAKGISSIDPLRCRLDSLRSVIAVGDGQVQVLHTSGVRFPVGEGKLSGHGTAASALAEIQEPVSINYTSGSTGDPKGVVHTHESWLHGIAYTQQYHGITASDTALIPFPLHHAYSFRHVLANHLVGANVVLANDIYDALKQLRQHRPTSMLLVPAAVRIVLDRFRDLLATAASHLKYVEIGTGALDEQSLEQLQRLLPTTRIALPYGLTEARVGFLACGRDGCVNQIADIAAGLEVGLVRDDERQPADVGRILLRGKGLMWGYWGQTIAQREQLHRDGLLTWDLGRVDGDRKIRLLGRADEVINVGGRKVHPQEVERVLIQHPAVLDAMAVRAASDVTGETIHAHIVAQTSRVGEDAIRAHCRMHLEQYKVPTTFHLQTSLPRSSLGKLLRGRLAHD